MLLLLDLSFVSALLLSVKEKMQIKMARLITANNEKPITSVGFICGDGGKYWTRALDDHLDAFITGMFFFM